MIWTRTPVYSLMVTRLGVFDELAYEKALMLRAVESSSETAGI
jgi:hypothetical protein